MQTEFAVLFETLKLNIRMLIKKAFVDGEIKKDSVVKYYLTTAVEGNCYRTKYYNLDAILAAGYRVRSTRGV